MDLPARLSPVSSPDEETLRAVINRIIPADDFPNAQEAGVAEYLRRQIAGDAHYLAPTIELGLAALDDEARLAVDRPFTALPPDAQDSILDRIARDETRAAWLTAPVEFFAVLVRLVNEGYYADPANGGNRCEAAWRMLGFDSHLPGEGGL